MMPFNPSVMPGLLRQAPRRPLARRAAAWFFCAAVAAGAADRRPQWDATLKSIATYQSGGSHAGLTAVEGFVRDALGSPADRAALERRLIELLRSGATADCKRFVCRHLAIIGSSEAVPALAALLHDADLADMARFALEPMPDPAVDNALLAALAKGTGRFKIGVINSLGARRTATAVAPLAKLLSDPDDAIARAAISAVERIHSLDALAALQQACSSAPAPLRPRVADGALAVAHALLARGEKQPAERAFTAFYQPSEPPTIRAAALKGLLAADAAKHSPRVLAVLRSEGDALQPLAADLVRTLPGVAAVVAELPKYSPRVQALVLAALAGRGEAAALPAALAAVQSAGETVAAAACKAVGSLGGAEHAPLLVERVIAGSAAARDALTRLRGARVDAAILKMAADQPPRQQAALIEILAARNAVSATPTLLPMARSPAAETREAALQALGSLAREPDVPELVKLVVENEAAEKALTAAVMRMDNPAKWAQAILSQYPHAAPPNRCALLRVLRFSGDAKALALVREEMKSADEPLRDAALRAMADWPNSDPAEDLLRLSREGASTTQRVLAFRGLVRMGEAAAQFSGAAGLKLLRSAMDASPRTEDKRLVLSALRNVARTDALQMAQACLADPKLASEAGAAILKISDALGDKQPDIARKAVEQVLAGAKSENLRKQAKALLEKLGAAEN